MFEDLTKNQRLFKSRLHVTMEIFLLTVLVNHMLKLILTRLRN